MIITSFVLFLHVCFCLSDSESNDEPGQARPIDWSEALSVLSEPSQHLSFNCEKVINESSKDCFETSQDEWKKENITDKMLCCARWDELDCVKDHVRHKCMKEDREDWKDVKDHVTNHPEYQCSQYKYNSQECRNNENATGSSVSLVAISICGAVLVVIIIVVIDWLYCGFQRTVLNKLRQLQSSPRSSP